MQFLKAAGLNDSVAKVHIWFPGAKVSLWSVIPHFSG